MMESDLRSMDEKVRQAYRDARDARHAHDTHGSLPSGPPTAIDDAIRAAARRAVAAKPVAIKKNWTKHWTTPIAAAATVMLTASVIFVALDERPDVLESTSLASTPGIKKEMSPESMAPKPAAAPEQAATTEPTSNLALRGSAVGVIAGESAGGQVSANVGTNVTENVPEKMAQKMADRAIEKKVVLASTIAVHDHVNDAATSIAPRAAMPTAAAAIEAGMLPPIPSAPSAPAIRTFAAPAMPSAPSAPTSPAPPLALAATTAVTDVARFAQPRLEERKPDASLQSGESLALAAVTPTFGIYAAKKSAEPLAVAEKIAGNIVDNALEADQTGPKSELANQASHEAMREKGLAKGLTKGMSKGPAKDTGKEQQESADLWVARMTELNRQNKTKELTEELKRFRKRYPAVELPKLLADEWAKISAE